MELKQLQTFAALVKYRSFTRAAERLYLSQPTISTHLRQLEEELNTRLIFRTTKALEVTPSGWEVYEAACEMLALRDGLLRRWNSENVKHISLGTSTIPSAYILPELLPAFRAEEPDVQFDIHQSDSEGVLDGLLHGRFDLGMVGMERAEEGLVFLPLCQDSMVLITPVTERYQALRALPETPLEELLREPILLREQGSGSRKCVESYFERIGIQENELNITARLNDQESIKALVAGGLGISIISARAAEGDRRAGRLLTFPLPKGQAARSLSLVYRRGDRMRGETKRFLDFAAGFYGSSPAEESRS